MAHACVPQVIVPLKSIQDARFGIGTTINVLLVQTFGISSMEFALRYHLNAKLTIWYLVPAYHAMMDTPCLMVSAVPLQLLLLIQTMLDVRIGSMELASNAGIALHLTRMESALLFLINARPTPD